MKRYGCGDVGVKPIERDVGGGAQQRAEFHGAVDVEENDLAAIVGQQRIQRRQDRRRADGEIDHRLEGQNRRQGSELTGAREALDLGLQRIGHPIRLAGAIDRERVVLETD